MDAPDRPVPSLFMIPLTLFLVGCLLFIALLYGHRDLTILTLLVLGLGTSAKLWARLSLSGMRCRSVVDRQKVFPGEKLTLKMEVENAKFLPVWFRVKVPVGNGLLLPSDVTPLIKEGSLVWYQRTRFEWGLTAQRRGVHQIGPSHIETGDLFAFFSKDKKSETFNSVIVYPRLIPLKSLSLPRRDFFGVPGAQSPVQDPIYILGTRDYQQGQPAKSIHWKASARHNRLQGKVFEPSEQEKVLLVVEVDQFARAKAEDEFEHTLEATASLAVRLTEQGYAVGLTTNGAIVGEGPAMIPVARNRGQLPAILEILARLRMESRGGLLETIQHGLDLPWGVSTVLFLFEEDKSTFVIRKYFEHRRIPVTFLVCRPRLSSRDWESNHRSMVRDLEEIASPPAVQLKGN
jgi:uncharacterized protein (DUF58 family)